MSSMEKVFEGVYIVGSSPVLYIEDINAIVFADAHLGFEEEMARQGVFIPRAQLRKIMRVLDKVFALVGDVEKVIINGDLKHSFDRLSRQERFEVNELLRYLKDRVKEIIVIRGNHDNFLPLVLKDHGIELRTQYETTISGLKILFTHGHLLVDLKNYDLVIIGHEHPSISIVDQLGLISKVPCYLLMPLTNGSKLLVLPAIGAYQSGNTVSLDKSNYLSPIVREYGCVEEAEPIAIIEDTGVLHLPKLSLLYTMLHEIASEDHV